MIIEDILKELSHYHQGTFPREALAAAVEQQGAITPHLLAYLQELADLGENIDEDTPVDMVLFALYLLAQFREQRAYPVIIKLCSQSTETVEYLIGDAITAGLNRILASVFDGDLNPIKDLIERESTDEFIGAAALCSLYVLNQQQQLSRDDLLDYYRSLFQEKLPRKESHVWSTLCIACEEFGFVELLDDIRKAYKDDLVDPMVCKLASIEKEILEHPGEVRFDSYEKLSLIDDTIAELENWASFNPSEDDYDLDMFDLGSLFADRPIPDVGVEPEQEGRLIHSGNEPLIRESAKVGRNDPCPCGSGKKFKKCCG
ncbi:DUF1186 domain-containing protein [Endozoicomonas sp. Mp262]